MLDIGLAFSLRRLAHCLADDPKLIDPLAVCKPGDVRFGTLQAKLNLFNGLPVGPLVVPPVLPRSFPQIA